MPTIPKMRPCPRCDSAEGLAVYRYDNGARHVECDNGGCQYLGPGEGSIRAAIRVHNLRAALAHKQDAAVAARDGSGSEQSERVATTPTSDGKGGKP